MANKLVCYTIIFRPNQIVEHLFKLKWWGYYCSHALSKTKGQLSLVLVWCIVIPNQFIAFIHFTMKSSYWIKHHWWVWIEPLLRWVWCFSPSRWCLSKAKAKPDASKNGQHSAEKLFFSVSSSAVWELWLIHGTIACQLMRLPQNIECIVLAKKKYKRNGPKKKKNPKCQRRGTMRNFKTQIYVLVFLF